MEKEEFKRTLTEKGYMCEEKEGKIIVNRTNLNEINITLDLSDLKTIPPNVIFRNVGNVNLSSIVEIPRGVEFENHSFVYLASLRKIDPSVRFSGSCSIVSRLLGAEICEDGSFKNGFKFFTFGVKGINDVRIVNMMVGLGLFERRVYG